jgi:hypothetical protein
MRTLLTTALAILACATGFAQDSRRKNIGDLLSEQTYKVFRDYMAPVPDDWMWLSIPWQPDLGTGIMLANEQDKPVALWAECGHPLAEV